MKDTKDLRTEVKRPEPDKVDVMGTLPGNYGGVSWNPITNGSAPAYVDPESLPSLRKVEREHIIKVYEACNGEINRTSRILNIGRQTLYNKLAKYGMGRGPRE